MQKVDSEGVKQLLNNLHKLGKTFVLQKVIFIRLRFICKPCALACMDSRLTPCGERKPSNICSEECDRRTAPECPVLSKIRPRLLQHGLREICSYDP